MRKLFTVFTPESVARRCLRMSEVTPSKANVNVMLAGWKEIPGYYEACANNFGKHYVCYYVVTRKGL